MSNTTTNKALEIQEVALRIRALTGPISSAGEEMLEAGKLAYVDNQPGKLTYVDGLIETASDIDAFATIIREAAQRIMQLGEEIERLSFRAPEVAAHV